MSSRILINLAVFAGLGVLLVGWAFQNVITFDFIERPYHVTVEFESSPGLHPGYEVDYLGTRIGKIDSVRLVGRTVMVRLDIERDVRIPHGVTAAAARKSAVGEPVVELTPKPGQASGPKLDTDGSALIPVADTAVPPKYGDLFGAVIDTLEAVDPADAGTLTREIAAGWAGRAESLRQIINGTDQLTTTAAENSALIDGLTRDFGQIANVLARNRAALGAGVDNLAVLTDALRGVRTEIAGIRDRGPELLKTFNALLAASGPDLDCMVGALADIEITKTNPDALADLRRTLRQSGELVFVLNNIVGEDQGKSVLNVVFLLTLRTKATLEYRKPLAQPDITPVPACPDGRVPAQTKQKEIVGDGPGETIPTHNPEPAQPVRNAADEDDTGGPPGWLVYVPPIVALLVLIKVMMGSVPVLSRLRRRKG